MDIEKFGARHANTILKQIETYFESFQVRTTEPKPAPTPERYIQDALIGLGALPGNIKSVTQARLGL